MQTLQYKVANKEEYAQVMNILKILGVRWGVAMDPDKYFYWWIILNIDDTKSYIITGGDDIPQKCFKTVTFQELIAAAKVFIPKKRITLQLNKEYEALYIQGDTVVKVGCQEIPVTIIHELSDKIKAL